MKIMSRIARGLADKPHKPIYVLVRLGQEKGIVNLGVGEPDFDSPTVAVEAAVKALKSGQTHYSPDPGLLELREAVQAKVRMENQINVNAESQIIITPGSSTALFGSLMTTVQRGDEVIIPAPAYVSYSPSVEFLEAKPIQIDSVEENRFIPDEESLKKAISKRTAGLILSTPTNPTGTVWDRESLRIIADLAVDHSFYVYSDELYSRIIYEDTKHVSIASLDGAEDIAITISGMSKNYAMTGLRIGWVMGPEHVIDSYRKIHQYVTIAASTPSQIAAVAALQDGDNFVEEMVEIYRERRDFLLKAFDETNPLMKPIKPEGSFYMFVNIKDLVRDHLTDMIDDLKSERNQSFRDCLPQAAQKWISDAVSGSKIAVLWLMAEADVLVSPGGAFGRSGEGYLRISFAQPHEKLTKAADRIKAALYKWN